jgi:iron complex transport system permease protein
MLRVSLPLLAGLAAVMAISLSLGPANVSLLDALLSGDSGAGVVASKVVWDLRLPRAVSAAACGMGLAACGVVFQALLANPLAEPFVLGVSGGAAAAAALATLAGASMLAVNGWAFAGAVITTFLVLGLASRKGVAAPAALLLSGVVANTFFGAAVMLATSLAAEERLYSMLFWLYGDLGRAGGTSAALSLVVAASCSLLFFLRSRQLNLLAAGEELARDLGVNVTGERLLLYLAASLCIGVLVSACGIVGFVGLIVPHTLRLMLGGDHRVLLPASALAGGLFLVACDTFARTVAAPLELPVGVVTAALGAPFFAFMLRRGRFFPW